MVTLARNWYVDLYSHCSNFSALLKLSIYQSKKFAQPMPTVSDITGKCNEVVRQLANT